MKLTASPFIAAAALLSVSAPAAAETFAGPYAGVQAGWSKNKIGGAQTDIGRADIGRSRDATTAGVFAGYNYKATDRIVLSAEAGFSMGFDDQVTRIRGANLASIDPEYAFDLGARAGYLVTDNTLLYVRGGYENMRAAVRLTNAAGARYGKDVFDGWSLGGGVERAINDRISARLEYRYSDLGEGSSKFERHQALFGVAYHF
ncbi:outer membrane protein [Sphingomonas crocodyli]|uniref:Porin family protein n=1 Tax=Sphingomonas crocodyli TaxID=1979270 RepID=A0A437M066_9SPHN|nr:porin family protein [Sphingomonas crocodyli]RVT90904.1 porin family protein [Sphingomonas crocodyli]